MVAAASQSGEGQKIALFWKYPPHVCLSIVEEVYHSDLFTTALVKLDDAVSEVTSGYERAYINVWTSKHRHGYRSGVLFCVVGHPLDDIDVKERLNIWRDRQVQDQRPKSTDGVGSNPAVGTDGSVRLPQPTNACGNDGDKQGEWTVKLSRRAETEQKHKTLV